MITVTMEKAVAAYKAIDSISMKDFPMLTAYKLFVLKKKLQEKFDFQVEQEKMLINKYSGTPNESGTCKFKDQKTANQVREKLKELRDVAVEFDLDKLKIKFEENITLTINDVEAIDDFVEITE